MKIFLTGGTGFIGSHFINQAHAVGHEIIALRRSPASVPRVPLGKAPVWLDKAMPDLQPADFIGSDTLVHLAAHSANVPYDTLEACIQHNVIEPIQMIRTASVAGIQKYVIAGSCFEYGRSGERYDKIPPNAPLEPTLSYPASKAAASVAFHSLAQELSIKLSIHRIFQVFGEGEDPGRLWPSLRKAALAGESLEMTPAEQVRDFINVTEVAAQLLAAIDLEPLPGIPLVMNLGTGEEMTLRNFAEHWWKTWNASGTLHFGAKPYRDGEIMRYIPLV
ncbi:NAD(P)-dependent oxidoreductase [Luteolibacter pohnpeiensis]|uniref:NAD(P)-dependent oxidoreductase n=1 Tax=Luteolibacter pohnpeiensis TaxID=454153 RepID=A0A934S4N7_9BACT|nr:NAD(P)-dependent oxidoreductase [Luteolibacter pohnpeiensis]MBK1882476.1 NAD(P)-dependent oxidoreductase [Luteolibacter pohnpeiensis]